VAHIRRDGNDAIKKAMKDKKISEDDERRALEEIPETHADEIKKMEEMSKTKENKYCRSDSHDLFIHVVILRRVPARRRTPQSAKSRTRSQLFNENPHLENAACRVSGYDDAAFLHHPKHPLQSKQAMPRTVHPPAHTTVPTHAVFSSRGRSWKGH